MNGDVVVEVTFTETAIREIQVVSHKETDGIWEKPVDTIPKAIVDTQSLDVDAVAGATMTSNAILNAVEDCVTQAGGDPAALKKGSNTPSGSPSAMPSVSPSATNGNGTNGAATSPAPIRNWPDGSTKKSSGVHLRRIFAFPIRTDGAHKASFQHKNR